MDEMAAARFGKKVEAQDNDQPPTVSEVLNAALKQTSEEPGFTEVIVIACDPSIDKLLFMGNLPKVRDLMGMLAIAMQGPR